MPKFKRLYFLGAGSSSLLKLPTTDEQAELFEAYRTDKKHDDELTPFLKDFYSNRKLTVNSLYNLLDYSILANLTLDSPKKEKNSYPPDKLIKIRRKCNGIILEEFQKRIKDKRKRKDFEKWLKFYKRLARYGIAKKKENIDSKKLTSPDFIYHDYAIVNLNWDLFSNIPMMMAHKDINNGDKNYIPLSSGNKRLSVYSDFSFYVPFINGKVNDDGTPLTEWYSYNDAACYRLNDEKNGSNKIATIVKTYLLHGNMNLFRCAHCGNQVYLLDQIDMADETLYIDNVIADKKIATCPYCNADIKSLDSEMLMQSNFKIKSPYIEKMQEEFKAVVRDTEEIIFLGYSLPTDDMDYRTIFTSYVSDDAEIKVVLFDSNYKCENVFEYIEYYKNLNDEHRETAKRFKELFGNRVKFNFSGVPSVFDNDELYT